MLFVVFERDEDRAREVRAWREPDREETRHGNLGGNRTQIIHLKPIQSTIEIDSLSMLYMDIIDEVLIEGTSTFFETSDIAISSVNFESRLLLFPSVILYSNDPAI